MWGAVVVQKLIANLLIVGCKNQLNSHTLPLLIDWSDNENKMMVCC